MKSLDEIKKILEEKQLPEISESVIGLIEAERQKGIELHRKANGEAERLRKYKQAHKNIITELEMEESDDLDSVTANIIDKIKKPVDGKSVETVALQRQIAELSKKFTAIEAEKNALAVKNKRNIIATKLSNDLRDMIAADLLINEKINSGEVDVDETGEVYFKKGSEVVDYSTGVNTLKTERKDLLKSNQTAGSGSSNSSGSAGKKQISVSEWNTLSGKDRALYMQQVAEGKADNPAQ